MELDLLIIDGRGITDWPRVFDNLPAEEWESWLGVTNLGVEVIDRGCERIIAIAG